MKTGSKIALGALAVGAAAFAWARKHTKGAAGIGAIATARRKRLESYFNGDYLVTEVEVDLEWTKGKDVHVVIRFRGRMSVDYWISIEDAKWLSELCDKMDIEFNAWNGNVWLPTLHKKISYTADEFFNM